MVNFFLIISFIVLIMPQIEVIGEGQADFGDFVVHVAIIPLKKSYLILITDQAEYGIGSVILSTPPVLEGMSATSSPITLFGLKNNLLANLVGKTASKKLQVPVMTLLLIKNEQLKPEIITKIVMDAVLAAIAKIPKTFFS
jgi:hypothetical protein